MTPSEGSFEVDSKRTESPKGAGLAEMWESSQVVPSGEEATGNRMGRGLLAAQDCE